jgi:hypothetical protein
MNDQERIDPDPARNTDESLLPVRAGERRPALPPTAAPAVRADGLARAMSGGLLAAPLLTAAVVGATATAVAAGAAAVTRILWPWLAGRGVAGPAEPAPVAWIGPGVRISYTHLEVHWPSGR